jgi:hypothetical protein
MIKGYDKNKIPFSVFVLISEEEKNKINILSDNIDLIKYNIIYKTIRHDFYLKIIELMLKYTEDFFKK